MKPIYPLLLLCILIAGVSTAQETARISFNKKQDTIQRKETAAIYPITIKIEDNKIDSLLPNYTITVKADDDKSTFPRSGYELNFSSVTLDKFTSEYTFFLTIKKDSAADRNRHLFLNIEVTKNGRKNDSVNVATTDNTILDITVEGNITLNKYNYLAYIGTNFDLIDGIKAKDLFFATNLFSPPSAKGNGFGFSLTLYGNRSLTLTNTPERENYTSKIVGIGGDSARTYITEGLKTINRVSDNLGATFSPLIRIGKVSDPERTTQLYYAPQLEFIWRRTKITTAYTANILIDSVDRPNRPITGTVILTPETETLPLNVYDVYMGLAGLYLRHENSYISIRVQGSFGVSYSYTARNSKAASNLKFEYDRDWNFTCFLRTWITEPTTGLTFGAEVTNNFIKKNSHQPYYNVTLSKAINLNALAGIFQPLTSR